jgi:uncharacterized iron-regulated membrane protein
MILDGWSVRVRREGTLKRGEEGVIVAVVRNAKFWVRKSHRWLGLLIGIQLLLWTVSGLYFTLIPIEAIRGEDQIRESAPVNYAFTPMVSPAEAISNLAAQTGPSLQVHAVNLRQMLGRPIYDIRYSLSGEKHVIMADAASGELRLPLSEVEAREIAQQDFAVDSPITSVEYIEEVAADAEYRGGPLPAWRVSFAHDSGTRIYVSAEQGRVIARRNDVWRIFDFMWMLHILDFEDRDDFNTLLLQLLAVLGVITIVSGFILWGMTTTLFGRRLK